MTYAELAMQRDTFRDENETLRSIMNLMLEKGKRLEAENEKLKNGVFPHGHWNVKDYGDGFKEAECSACGESFPYCKGELQIGIMPHCPKCGAKMDGKDK